MRPYWGVDPRYACPCACPGFLEGSETCMVCRVPNLRRHWAPAPVKCTMSEVNSN